MLFWGHLYRARQHGSVMVDVYQSVLSTLIFEIQRGEKVYFHQLFATYA